MVKPPQEVRTGSANNNILIHFSNLTQKNGTKSGLDNESIYLTMTGAVGSGASVNTLFLITGGKTTTTTSPTSTDFKGVPLSALPKVNGLPTLTVVITTNSTNLDLQSARLYISSAEQLLTLNNWQSGPTPSAPTSPSGSNFIYDFIEFAQPTGLGLNVDTSQVDQVGFAYSVNVSPRDGTNPSGSGILTGVSRATLIADYMAAMNAEPFTPFLDAVVTGTAVGGSTQQRILSPQNVIDSTLSAEALTGSVAVGTQNGDGSFSTTYTITGPGSPPPTNGGLTGKYASGLSMPAGAIVTGVSTGGDLQDVYISVSEAATNPWPTAQTGQEVYFVNAASVSAVNAWFGPAVNSSATQSNPIDTFFNFWKAGGLQIEANYNGADLVYNGQTIEVDAPDLAGSTSRYTVLRFTNADDGYYDIFYPYYTTNSPSGKLTPFGSPVPLPPSWTLQSGNLYRSPSEMVFQADGVFADSTVQDPTEGSNPSNGEAPTRGNDNQILGAFENAVVTALARGYASTWTFGSTTNFDKESNTSATFTVDSTNGLTVGMNVSSLQIGLPMTITAVNSNTITVLTTASFAETNAISYPELLTYFTPYQSGQTWSPYAAFLHNKLSGYNVTIGGRAYALPFDDQGGFSSDLNTTAGGQISVTLNPFATATAKR